MSTASTGALVIQLKDVSMSQVAILAEKTGATLQTTLVPGVIQASGDPRALRRLSTQLAGASGLGYVEPSRTLSLDRTPSDPSYGDGSLWGLNGTNGIKAPTAWDVTTGSTKVVVADVDTGVDYNHPDLYQNIWINQAEIPASRRANLQDVDGDGLITFYDLNYKASNGSKPNQGVGKINDVNSDGRITATDLLASTILNSSGQDTGKGGWANGVSDDGDGYVDDLVGWNFVANTNNPFDDNGHGTHVSGTIGAMGNNGVGVAGVSWQVQIMALKFLDSSGGGTDVGAAAAIRYAAAHGARASNNSYGTPDGGSTMADAISFAAAAGSVFVASAGNSASDNDVSPSFPGSYPNPNIISIAAIDSSGQLTGFSNYGATTVDLAAPGAEIYSTFPNNGYESLSGTSMAAPHVTGTVALLYALHPTWTYSQIIQQVLSTVTPRSDLAGKVVSGGILNAGAAVGTLNASSQTTFVGTDRTTQGSWKGVYGASGYNLANNGVNLPAYATVAVTGQSTTTWGGASSTNDVRALQKVNGTNRIAATWYGNQFTIDVGFNDGRPHPVSLYAVDWDSTSRSQRFDLIDPATNKVIDSRTISSFHDGVYLTWNVSGRVLIRVTRLTGTNAVVSGLFIGGAYTTTASFVGTDRTTQGSWKGVYGASGYNLANNGVNLPAYAALAFAGQSTTTWGGARSTNDVRALQKVDGADRIAAAWYGNQFTIDVAFNDGLAHPVSLYAVDWDSTSRSQRFDLIDPATNKVIDSRTISSFHDGVYLTWNVSGRVLIRVTRLTGTNAVVSGLFIG